MTPPPLLSVRGLGVEVARRGAAPASVLTDIEIELAAGDTVGILGESGSGKSTLALALIGLLPPGFRAHGSVLFEGRDLLTLADRDLSGLRGSGLGLVLQNPWSALDPRMTAGAQIVEGLRLHRGLDRGSARREALRLLDLVRLADARRRLDSYPHELSGGERQRVALAIALGPDPRLLIADEPTSALDATVEAEILDVLSERVRSRGMGLILISHDLGTIARTCATALVLYSGTRREAGPTRDLLSRPAHPYTRALIAARPRPRGSRIPRASIAAELHRPVETPPGCRFAPRCDRHVPRCDDAEPPWHGTVARGFRCLRPATEAEGSQSAVPSS